MSRLPRWALASSLAAGFALAPGVRPVAAQGSVGFTPWAGIYVPTRNSFSSVGNDIKRKNSFIGGARLTFWGKSPLGIELSAGYSPARIRVAGATVNADRNSKVFLAGLKLMAGVSPASSGVGIYLGAGPAVIRRGEDVLHTGTSQTDFGAVAGAGIRFPLAHAISVRFDAEDYLYGGDFDGSKSFQNDLALSAGLSFTF